MFPSHSSLLVSPQCGQRQWNSDLSRVTIHNSCAQLEMPTPITSCDEKFSSHFPLFDSFTLFLCKPHPVWCRNNIEGHVFSWSWYIYTEWGNISFQTTHGQFSSSYSPPPPPPPPPAPLNPHPPTWHHLVGCILHMSPGSDKQIRLHCCEGPTKRYSRLNHQTSLLIYYYVLNTLISNYKRKPDHTSVLKFSVTNWKF